MSSPWRGGETIGASARAIREESRQQHRRKGQNSPYRQTPEALSSSVWDEFSRLYVDEDRTFRHQLDEQVAEQEKLHRDALALAHAEHERVRESAERARERVELEIDRERRRREEDDIRALEAERAAAAEREAAERRRLRDELQRKEEEQRNREAEQKDIEARRARLAEQEQKAKAEAEGEAVRRKHEQDEVERKAKEAASVKQSPEAAAPAIPSASNAQIPAAKGLLPPAQGASSHTQPVPSTAVSHANSTARTPGSAPTTTPSVAPSLAPSSEAREIQHRKYLDLHQRLKTMRKYVLVEGKKRPELKTKLGEWRRSLNVYVGQFTANKEQNKKPLRDILILLSTAQTHLEPSVDVSSYLISSPTDGTPILMSGPLVYLLNTLSKNIITQLISESEAIAEPIGIMAVTIFANKKFQANGTSSLIDILLAKYHACCPVLWGISGNEKTEQGRARLGWWKTEGKSSGEWETEQRHAERMDGLGRGYAAISLRDFGKSPNNNPYPPSNYWKTISYIVNTPPSQVQPTHFYVLKALIHGYIPKFVGFYGMAALVALRKALIEFPAQAPVGPARNAVMIMPQEIQRDLRLTL